MTWFSKSFRACLRRLKLNQTAAAKKIGVSQAVVSMWLSGEREPTRLAIFGIASSLGVTFEELIGATEPEKRTTHAVVVREERAVYGAEKAALTEVLARLKTRWRTVKDRRLLELAIRATFDQDAAAVIKWLDEDDR